MTTKFEFGYGEGEIFRRRMKAQGEMYRQVAKEQQELPEEDRRRLEYDSDYYGFRGAGRRTAEDRSSSQAGKTRRGRRDGGTRRRTR